MSLSSSDAFCLKVQLQHTSTEISNLSSINATLSREIDQLKCELKNKNFSFCHNIMAFTAKLFNNPDYSNIIFRTNGGNLYGHRFVLEARDAKWVEKREEDVCIIDILDVDAQVAKTFVHWLYAEVSLDSFRDNISKLLELLGLASNFNQYLLLDRIEILLMPNVSRANFASIFDRAFHLKAEKLLIYCFSFISDAYEQFNSLDFSGLSPKCLLPIVRKCSAHPIQEAVRLDRVDLLQLIFDSWSLISNESIADNINHANSKGDLPLSLCFDQCNFDIGRLLLKYGAKVDEILPSKQRSLLQDALFTSNLLAATFLLQNDCKAETKDPSPVDSALQIACKGFSKEFPAEQVQEVISLLLENGADAGAFDANGQSALHNAILNFNSTALAALLSHKSSLDVNLINRDGVPPLWLALVAQFSKDVAFADLRRFGFTNDIIHSLRASACDLATQLITVGAEVNVKDSCGDNPLMTATRLGISSVCHFLLNLDDLPLAVDEESLFGETALYLAVESDLEDIACLLVKRGASPNKMIGRRSHLSPSKAFCIDDCSITTAAVVNYTESVHDLGNLSVRAKCPSLNPFDSSSEEGEEDIFEEDEKMIIAECLPDTILVFKETALHLAVQSSSMDRLLSLFLEREIESSIQQPDWFLVNDNDDSLFGLAIVQSKFELAQRILEACKRQLKTESMLDVFKQLEQQMRSGSLLQRAIANNNFGAVQLLLDKSIEVNPLPRSPCKKINSTEDVELIYDGLNSEIQHSPLWLSLTSKQEEIASLLVSRGADVDAWTPTGVDVNLRLSLLHRAVLTNRQDAAEFLLKVGCDCRSGPQRIDSNSTVNESHLAEGQVALALLISWKTTPLHMAASLGLLETVSALLSPSTKVDINCQDSQGRTPLHLSIINGQQEATDLLLSDARISLRLRDFTGCTVFHTAMQHHNLQVATALQHKNPHLSLERDNSGKNFLHVAVEKCDREAIFFLIAIGVDVNVCVRDPEQLSPLHLCITNGVPEDILRSLILAGALVSQVTQQKRSGLHLSVYNNQPRLLHCLLENGASPNDVDSEKNTALHLAMKYSNFPCANCLLSVPETDVSMVNICGQQPLHLLADQPTTDECIQDVLFNLRPNIDINAQDAVGNTPLMIAFGNKNANFCIYLAHRGAALGVVNSDNWSIFTSGVKSPLFHILKRILDSLQSEPAWTDSSFCGDCFIKFGLSVRKHHCRHCGRVVCKTCSDYDVPIVKYGLNKPVRVCMTCFLFLNNPSIDY